LNSTLIFPNPAKDFFYILLTDMDLQYRNMKIFDSKGIIIMENSIEYGLNEILLPEKLASGLYSVVLAADSIGRSVKKLIIID